MIIGRKHNRLARGVTGALAVGGGGDGCVAAAFAALAGREGDVLRVCPVG